MPALMPALAALAVAAPPAAAITVTISTPVTSPNFRLAPGNDLKITTTGQLLSPGNGTSILIEGDVENAGLIRTGWDAQSSLNGLVLLGTLTRLLSVDNLTSASLEAHHLSLFDTRLASQGYLSTGAILLGGNPSPSADPAGRPALTVGSGSEVKVLAPGASAPSRAGRWDNYGAVNVFAGGRIAVESVANLRTLPATSAPAPYGLRFDIGAAVPTGLPAGQLGRAGGDRRHASGGG